MFNKLKYVVLAALTMGLAFGVRAVETVSYFKDVGSTSISEEISLSIDGKVLSDGVLETNVMVGVAIAWPVEATAQTATTINASWLPSGVKYTTKDIVDSKSGEMIAQANTLYGTPKVVTKVDKPKQVKFMVRTASKAKREFVLSLAVDSLPTWAVGSFNGGSSEGQFSLTVAKNGKMSGKWLSDGKTWRLSATGYDNHVEESESMHETLFATLLAKCGKDTQKILIGVTQYGLTGYDGTGIMFTANTFNWRSGELKALGAKIAKAPAFLYAVEGEQPGNLTLNFGYGGKVKVVGQFKDAASGKLINVSGSAVLCPVGTDEDENAMFNVYIYLPARGRFNGYSESLCLVWNGKVFLNYDDEAMWKLVFEAYTYTYPLVMVDLTKTVAINTIEPKEGKAPINQLAHNRSVADASYKDIVTPNCDTVYTQAWMDLSKEPIIYIAPEADRFYESQIMSGWTDTFIAIEEPGVYAFARKDWKGELPKDVKRVDSPTTTAWMLARVLLKGKEDLDNVVAIQKKMQMMPLSDYLKSGYVAPKGTYSEENDFVPSKKVLTMTLQEFFDAANKLMIENPPADADKDVIARLKAINVGPGLKFDASVLPGNVNERWAKMVESARSIWLENSIKFAKLNGIWMFFGEPLGNFGTEYDYRALTAHDGIGANTVDVAIYPKAETDFDGNVLTGEKTYIMHFDSMPPIKDGGFWSVTAYDEDSFLIDNPLDRYAINDRTDFKLNTDGTLDVILSNEKPDDTSNWLPVCSGVFQLFMRMYRPNIDAFSKWMAPTITPVNKVDADLLEKAFDYTLPLVMVELSKRNGTNVEADNGTGYAPINQLGHCKYLLDASFKGVVTPNVDTLYSCSYMDISDEPMVLVLPQTDRYMTAQIMNGWTKNISLIRQPGTYVFVKKGYKGMIPLGVKKIKMETSTVWMIIRTLCNGNDDLENIYALQKQTYLVPLSVYKAGKIDKYVPPKGEVKPEYQFVPVDYAMGMSMKDYFDLANSLMVMNPPDNLDKDILNELAAINVGPGCKFNPSLVDASKIWARIREEASERYDNVMKANASYIGQWSCLNDTSWDWKETYDYRAAIAMKAIGANSLKTAAYATTYTDQDGYALNGNCNYVLHFDSMPPIDKTGFWSVTAYGNDDFLVDNPINRYCINDRSDYKLNEDGSLDIIISSEQPSDTSNWLPISDQGFHLYLRMYDPQLNELQNWTAPVIIRQTID